MWRGVVESAADGRGTGLCPPECPVRPHDRIVRTHTDAHTHIAEEEERLKGKQGKGNHELAIYSSFPINFMEFCTI